MPELPDVEVFRRTLAHSSLHRRITAVEVADTQVLDDVSAAGLEGELTGSRLTGTSRHGKHLYVRRDVGPALALHFGMTAYVEPGPADAPEILFHARLDPRARACCSPTASRPACTASCDASSSGRSRPMPGRTRCRTAG
jgi:hypothetical protein